MEGESSECVVNTTQLLQSDAPASPTDTGHIEGTETEVTQSSSRCSMLGFCHTLGRKSPLTFALASSLCALTQFCTTVFIMSQITSLEKEFGFTSSQTGQIVSSAQIGSLCLVLPSGYLASRLHVPRSMTFAAVIFGLASVMIGLSRFIFPVSDVHNSSVVGAADTGPPLCWLGQGGGEGERCEGVGALWNGTADSGGATQLAYNPRAFPVYVFLIVCQVIRGAMGTTAFPMFTEYIESNAKKTDTGFYMGIFLSVSMLGAAVAFLGGGAISKVHVSLQPTDIDPTHPDWVGAWWLGFLIFGSLAAVAPVFLCRFPRHLQPPPPPPSPPLPPPTPFSPPLPPSPPSPLSSLPLCRESESSQEEGRSAGPKQESCPLLARRAVSELRGFFLSVARLMMNPVYLPLVLSFCAMRFAVYGIYVFMPKYTHDQFQIPVWKANYIMGGAELSMGTSGFLAGGWLTKRLKLTRHAMYTLTTAVNGLTVLIVLALMFVGCPQATLTGDPGDSTTSHNCSLPCACPEEVFPVCDRESGVTYYSPCHAGCSVLHDGVYENCSCTTSGQVYAGECMAECTSLYYYSCLFFIMIFFISVTEPLDCLLLVRSVPTSAAGLAIGFSMFPKKIIAFMVGPIFFGGLIDSFCAHWKTPCGVKGQCTVYNRERFRMEMHLYSLVSMVMAIAFILLSFLLYVCCPCFSAFTSEGAGSDEKHAPAEGEGRGNNPPQELHTLLTSQHTDAVAVTVLKGGNTNTADTVPAHH
ncbi:solute carrier organic anion transporter family member 2B1-like [Babylonia areolata]|uniref:solute carrier organic anion transporter family member 2B1-like n=1 Tax=Babylonia areolata TaxID=304850 RepID=UPI003FD60228